MRTFICNFLAALAAALREETGLLPGATGRFLIPELMQPPAARAPGHSSSHNVCVCVSSDLPTTTRFFALQARDAASQSHSQMSERDASGVRLIPYSFFLLPPSSLSAIFSHLVGKYFLLPAHFSLPPPSTLKGWNPSFQTLHLAAVSPLVLSPLGCDWQATIT